mgnify:CR=1 FL=1
MDENEFIEEGNTIGQCYLCKCKIRKTSAWHSRSTVNWAGKKICGACLYGLVKPVARAEKLYLKEMKDKDKKVKQIESIGAWVNPETGRIERA